MLRVEGVFHPDGYIAFIGRGEGGCIDHFGSKVGEFHGFFVAHALHRVGFGYHARIGSHEAIYIGPYFQNIGIHCGCNDGRTVVRSTPAQGGGAPLFVGGNKAREDGHFFKFLHPFPDLSVGDIEVYFGIPEFTVGLD